MRTHIWTLAVCLALGGCSASGSYQSGHMASQNVLTQIKAGTDKQTVERLLGAPTNRGFSNGEELWGYIATSSAMTTNPIFMSSSGSASSQFIQVYFKGNSVTKCFVTLSSGSLYAPNTDTKSIDCSAAQTAQ